VLNYVTCPTVSSLCVSITTWHYDTLARYFVFITCFIFFYIYSKKWDDFACLSAYDVYTRLTKLSLLLVWNY